MRIAEPRCGSIAVSPFLKLFSKRCVSKPIKYFRNVQRVGVFPFNAFEEYEKPKIEIPSGFYHFCEICATGCGVVSCEICDGDGFVLTKVNDEFIDSKTNMQMQPGGAGVPNLIGRARCRVCNGMGMIPCPLCAGSIAILSPPRDPRLDFPEHPFE